MPYLTTENFASSVLADWLEEINILSAANFDAPYKFIGFTALSVDIVITFFIDEDIDALTTFSAPLMLVSIHSKGLYSAVSICLC